MESFVTYSGRDLKLSQSINIDIFIYFHPLPVYASVKKFLLLFFILYFSISFNRPYFYWSLSSVRPAFIVDSRSRKFQVTNSTSANHFCAARSRCSGFETRRQKLDRIIGTERRCFCMIVVFLPPPFHRCPGAISRMVLYDTKKNYPILSPTRSILSRLLSALMFTKAESKIVNPMRKWHFRLI